MTGWSIEIDKVGLRDQLNSFGYLVGELKSPLSGFPVAADAGSASSEVATIVATLKAQAESVVAAETALSALALDVVDQLLAGDENAADTFDKIADVNFDD